MALYRFTKQLVIGTIFFMVVIGVIVWIWLAVRPQPTCFDSMQNQNEQGVDCGGICALSCKKEPQYPSLIVATSTFFSVEAGVYDVLGLIENKNPDFGAVSFGYRFLLLDASGTAMITRDGTSYTLPGEKKYLVERRFEAQDVPIAAILETFDEAWMEVTEFSGISLLIRDRSYGKVASGGTTMERATGVIVNRTGYDFQQVDVVVLLRNDAGRLIGTGSTDVRILRDGTQRAFEVRWPVHESVNVGRVDMEAYTNLLENENFLIRYGKGSWSTYPTSPVPGVLR
jgi:hypothetical protein